MARKSIETGQEEKKDNGADAKTGKSPKGKKGAKAAPNPNGLDNEMQSYLVDIRQKQNVLMKKLAEEEHRDKEAARQAAERERAALEEAEAMEQVPEVPVGKNDIQDPAAELERLKSELEKEKKEKAALASQLSMSQQLKEGGEREGSPAQRFKVTVPTEQLNESRRKSAEIREDSQEIALMEILPGEIKLAELDLDDLASSTPNHEHK